MKDKILKALESVIDPHIGINVVEMGMIEDIKVNGKNATISFKPTTPMCPMISHLTNRIKQAAESVKGIEKAEVKVIV